MNDDPFQFRPRTTERRSFVERRSGFDRRSGQDRRKAERRVANLPVALERRGGKDRRKRQRRSARDRRRRVERRVAERRRTGTDLDVQQVEYVLSAIGRAFHLSRLYPATHPAVLDAGKEISAALPELVAGGPVEWKIGPKGLKWRGVRVLPRDRALADLSGRLYAGRARAIVINPGVSAQHIFELFKVATGELASDDAALGQVAVLDAKALSRYRRSESFVEPAEGPAPLSRRSMGVFRPDALPPDVEARRLLACFARGADPGPRPAALQALAQLSPQLRALGESQFIADVVGVLQPITSERSDPELSTQAREIISSLVDDTVVVWMVHQLGEPGVSPERRGSLLRAVAAVADRASSVVVDAYLRASPAGRAAYLAAMRDAGHNVVGALLPRLGGEAPAVTAGVIDLLGAAGGSAAFEALEPCARHDSPLVRVHAVRAMTDIGGRRAAPVAAALLKDPEPAVRVAAARALGDGNDPAAAALIVARLASERVEDVTAELLGVLGQIGDGATVSALAAFATPGTTGSQQSTRIRVAATQALGALGTAEARETLMTLTMDQNSAVREAAAGGMQ